MKLLTIGALTTAQRAQGILKERGIRSRRVKLSAERSGCVYGIEVEDGEYRQAAELLAHGGIAAR